MSISKLRVDSEVKEIMKSMGGDRGGFESLGGDHHDPIKLYKCWECHKKQFQAHELVGHRCQKCRDERVALRAKIGSITPWKAEGLERAKRVGKLGPHGGPQWKPRKKRIKKPRTIVLLEKNKRLPTWNDKWKPEPSKQLKLKKSKKRRKKS